MKKKFILSLSLCAALMSSPVMADVVSDPAPQSEIRVALDALDYRNFLRKQLRKDLQQREAIDGKMDIDFIVAPLTNEILDKLATDTIGKYWSAKYAKKYTEQLGTPSGKLSAKFDQYSMYGNAQAEFDKLGQKEKLALLEVRRGLPYKSMENAMRQGLPEMGNAVAGFLREKQKQRMQEARKFFLEYLENLNAFEDGKLAEVPRIQPPSRTGHIKTDSENQLIYQFILKRDENDRAFSAKLNAGKVIDDMLKQSAVTEPVTLEKNLITIAEIEEMRVATAAQYDKLLESFFSIDGEQVMTAAERRNRIKVTDSAASRMVTTALEYSEAEAAYYAAIRRILLTCQAAKGKLTLENDNLVFSDEKDLKQFREHRTELLNAREVIKALDERERKRREQAIQNIRSGS
ncbi:hypothetical protein [Undibacterium luofuense]|uniref:Peptidylprolyl isomerase n=1 Tax=Undibacterium luofuense TaxID=2828733 RepID=A0A941DS23_9BURK|nr:hypothetical protein [Undibacterium luofuense]MBR7783831.1 hypothetical protein [Undibacterium luofuense]